MKKIAYMLVALSVSCQATVMPQQSRVIFHPGEVKRSLLLVNNEDAPVLVQSWVDLGRPDKKPGEKNFPFVALPAVFRLNKAEKRVITLIRSAQSASLPADRESLYWLNIYEISAVKKNIAQQKLNKFNLAMNTQLKIINRPFRDSYNFRERTQKLKFQTQQMAGTQGYPNIFGTMDKQRREQQKPLAKSEGLKIFHPIGEGLLLIPIG